MFRQIDSIDRAGFAAGKARMLDDGRIRPQPRLPPAVVPPRRGHFPDFRLAASGRTHGTLPAVSFLQPRQEAHYNNGPEASGTPSGEPSMNLTQIAFVLFALIALGGLTMTAMIAGRIRIPAFMGVGHGLGALAALAVLFAANLLGEDATPSAAWWALVVFLAGFTGGMLLFRVLFREKAPLALALVHGSIAVLGLYLLYGAAF